MKSLSQLGILQHGVKWRCLPIYSTLSTLNIEVFRVAVRVKAKEHCDRKKIPEMGDDEKILFLHLPALIFYIPLYGLADDGGTCW